MGVLENGYKGTYKKGELNGAALLVDANLKLMETQVVLFESAFLSHNIHFTFRV